MVRAGKVRWGNRCEIIQILQKGRQAGQARQARRARQGQGGRCGKKGRGQVCVKAGVCGKAGKGCGRQAAPVFPKCSRHGRGAKGKARSTQKEVKV